MRRIIVTNTVIFFTCVFFAEISFALPNCPSNQQLIFDECWGTFNFDNGDKHVGEWKNSRKHGPGTYTYANGSTVIGTWESGKQVGLGTIAYADGDKFSGYFENGEMNGQGVMIFGASSEWAGDIFIGEYKNNRRNGKGLYIWKNGDVDFCTYTDNEASNCLGSSAYDVAPELMQNFNQLQVSSRKKIQTILKSANFYSGIVDGKWGKNTLSGLAQFSALRMNVLAFKTDPAASKLLNKVLGSEESLVGNCPANRPTTWNDCRGHEVYENGDTYFGDYKNGVKSGHGTYRFANGDTYVGEWQNDTYNGAGTYKFSNGETHTGKYRDGLRNGHGKFQYANGDEYEGMYKNDKPNGIGTYTFGPSSDFAGDRYVGNHKNGQKNGLGTYLFASGKKYFGEFNNDTAEGKGTTIYPNGDKFTGTFKDGTRNGQGTYIFANGDKFTGEYKYDKPNGLGTYSYGPNSKWDGDKFTGTFKNGTRNGNGTYFYANGAKFVGYYEEDLRNGYGTYTDSDGKTESGIWKDDEFQAAAEPDAFSTPEKEATKEVATGTGFYVSGEGHIVTNFHVVEGCTEVKLRSSGGYVQTIRLAEDQKNDLALLKVLDQPNYVFALSTESPFPLQEIIVAGFPFGERYSSALKFTKGIISSLVGVGDNYSEIQIDAALQQGNSGGPIIDEYGNVIAVAVSKLDAKYMLDNYGVIPENINFGVKSSAVRNLLEANRVTLKSPSDEIMSNRELSTIVSDGTVYLSCWMNDERIKQMQNKKIMIEN